MARLIYGSAVSAFTSVLCCLGAILISYQASAQNTQEIQSAALSSVEEIYIGRSVREAHITSAEFCSITRTSFEASNEDRFTFRSTASRASDGRVVDADVQTIGSLHACFGQTADPAITSFYAEGLLGTIPFKGVGECLVVKPNFPERGLHPLRCFLDLSGLPAEYIGGVLTTNSVLSRKVLGTETDPPGYTQVSIATIRLWKNRTSP
jgi:hypothetical protein